MALTFKQKFNKKHGQPLDTPNSLTKIARLSGISYKNIKKIFEKGEGAWESAGPSRPGMQKQQWAYSRVYASISPGSKSAKIDKDLIKKTKKRK